MNYARFYRYADRVKLCTGRGTSRNIEKHFREENSRIVHSTSLKVRNISCHMAASVRKNIMAHPVYILFIFPTSNFYLTKCPRPLPLLIILCMQFSTWIDCGRTYTGQIPAELSQTGGYSEVNIKVNNQPPSCKRMTVIHL